MSADLAIDNWLDDRDGTVADLNEDNSNSINLRLGWKVRLCRNGPRYSLPTFAGPTGRPSTLSGKKVDGLIERCLGARGNTRHLEIFTVLRAFGLKLAAYPRTCESKVPQTNIPR